MLIEGEVIMTQVVGSGSSSSEKYSFEMLGYSLKILVGVGVEVCGEEDS